MKKCWFYIFPIMFVGTTILFLFPFTDLFVCQNIPEKLFKTSGDVRVQSTNTCKVIKSIFVKDSSLVKI